MKKPTLNYTLLKSSCVTALKQTYADYIKAVYNDLRFTGFDNDGNYFVLDGKEERIKKINDLRQEIERLLIKLDEIKEEIEKDGEQT